MKVNYSIFKDCLYIHLIGELDECSAVKTRELIDDIIKSSNLVNKVIFNFSKLSFMDSTGIGMLIGRYKKIKAKGWQVFVESPTTAVEKILQVSGLYSIMPRI